MSLLLNILPQIFEPDYLFAIQCVGVVVVLVFFAGTSFIVGAKLGEKAKEQELKKKK